MRTEFVLLKIDISGRLFLKKNGNEPLNSIWDVRHV